MSPQTVEGLLFEPAMDCWSRKGSSIAGLTGGAAQRLG
jgi:hypothetical protein